MNARKRLGSLGTLLKLVGVSLGILNSLRFQKTQTRVDHYDAQSD